MPSNYTEHFKLSQWERPDKVLMDDFNDDNQKIDAALLCHPSAELIAAATVEAETQQIEFDISQVDWSRYMMLFLRINTSKIDYLKISLGSGKEGGKSSSPHNTSMSEGDSFIGMSSVATLLMILPIFYSGEHVPLAFSVGSSTFPVPVNTHAGFGSGAGSKPLEQSTYIRIIRDTMLSPGDQAFLWGVK